MSIARALLPVMLTIAGVVHAQEPTMPQSRGTASRNWEFIALPALNFNSDEGFGYGALLEAYNDGASGSAYRFTVQPTLFFTTKGRRDVTLFVDAPRWLANGWRVDAFFGHEQELATPYYGRGNSTVEDESLAGDPDPYYYRYGRTRARALANVQRRMGQSPARLLVGAGFANVSTDATPFDSGTTLLERELAGRATLRPRDSRNVISPGGGAGREPDPAWCP